jgi:hypothetical protein
MIECPECKGSGFSGYGSGYGDVCGHCGGQKYFPEESTMTLTLIQIGILKEIAAGKISLDEDTSDFLRDQIITLGTLDGPRLIDLQGPSVFLTAAGQALLAPVQPKGVALSTGKSESSE